MDEIQRIGLPAIVFIIWLIIQVVNWLGEKNEGEAMPSAEEQLARAEEERRTREIQEEIRRRISGQAHEAPPPAPEVATMRGEGAAMPRRTEPEVIAVPRRTEPAPEVARPTSGFEVESLPRRTSTSTEEIMRPTVPAEQMQRRTPELLSEAPRRTSTTAEAMPRRTAEDDTRARRQERRDSAQGAFTETSEDDMTRFMGEQVMLLRRLQQQRAQAEIQARHVEQIALGRVRAGRSAQDDVLVSLGTGGGARRAVLLSEILGAPVALRGSSGFSPIAGGR